MDTCFMFSVLVLLEGILCFYMPNEDGDEKDRQISYYLQNRETQRDLNARLKGVIDTSYGKYNGNYKRNNWTPSFENAAAHTSITANNHQPNGDVTLTIQTIPTVELWWSFTESTTGESVNTIGEFRANGQSISSSIVYSHTMVRLCVNLAAQNFRATFLINPKAVATNRTDTLSTVVGLIEAPLNLSLKDNTLGFEYKQTTVTYPAPNPEFQIVYVSYVGNSTSPSIKQLRKEIVETNTRGTFHVSCEFKDINEDGQVWLLYQSYIRMDGMESLAKYLFVNKMIPIQIENSPAKEDAIFIPIKPRLEPIKVYLEPNFRYGSLLCYALGQPTPLVDFYKDDVLQYSITISFFGSVSFAFLPFDGRSLEEVTGRYMCNATSGSKSLVSEYLVGNFEDKMTLENKT